MKPSTLTCVDVGRLLYLLFETSLFHIFPIFSALAIYSPFIFSEALEFFTTPLSLCVCFVNIYIYIYIYIYIIWFYSLPYRKNT